MLKQLLKKAKSSKAFSMGEMLVATLILGLMTSALAVGISTSMNVYRDTVTYSEKRMLLSTLTESISNELRYCKEANFDATSTPNVFKLHNYTSNNFGFNSMLSVNDTGIITVKGTDLIGNGVYSNGQKLSANLVTIENGEVKTKTTKNNNAEIYYYKDTGCFVFTVAVYSGTESTDPVKSKTPESRTITVKPLETPDTENLYVAANTSGGT